MTAKSANLATLRTMNARSVLDALCSGRKLSRAEVARRLGMSKPTANHAIETLLDAGLVREAPRPEGELHYGAVFFEPVADLGHVLGIDIGSNWVRGAVADLDGSVRARYDHPRDSDDAETLLGILATVRARLVAQAPTGPGATAATVVAVAGIVDPATQVLMVSNEPRLEGTPLVAALRTVLPGPLEVDNDVNLAALGELRHGGGAEWEDFAFLSVGSGAGAGLVLDGKLRRGHHGAAGEVDFPAHRSFAVGSPAGDALQKRIASRYRAEAARAGVDGPRRLPTVQEVFTEAKAGRPLALQLVGEEARRIAATIAMIAQVVDVPLVVLGGEIGLNGDVLLEPIRARLPRLAPFPPLVRISRLGDAAMLTGAVSVAARTAWPQLVSDRLEAAGRP